MPFFFLSGKLKIILYEWRNSEHHRVSQTIYYADIGNKNPLIGLIIRTYNTLPFFFLSGKLKIILYEHHRVSQTIYYADIGNKESIDRFDNVIRCHFFLSGKLKIILYEWRNSEHHRVSQTISGIKNPLTGLIM